MRKHEYLVKKAVNRLEILTGIIISLPISVLCALYVVGDSSVHNLADLIGFLILILIFILLAGMPISGLFITFIWHMLDIDLQNIYSQGWRDGVEDHDEVKIRDNQE